jgi:hypothetical protein
MGILSNKYGSYAVFAFGLIALALMPASALGADPTSAQYESSLTQVSAGGSDPPSTASASASADAAGDLPFTGLDVGLLAAVAVGLIVTGIVLRHHRPSESANG